MVRQLVLYISLLVSFSLQAQSEKAGITVNDSIQEDSVTTPKPSAFKRAIKKFMNFSDFDTLYISPNRYNYALMATHFSNFEYYSVTSEFPQPQKLSFSPNPHNKIGLYFGWRWIFLGWSVDIDDIYRKTNRKNKGTEFDLSLYSSKLGVDIFYRRTGNNYKIHKIRGFYDEIPSDYSEDFSGLKVDIKGLNLYYIFNNRKFSYPAAFSQSTNQRRNAGTFIAGFSISKHNLDFDYQQLPAYIQERMNPGMKVNKIKYTNANISFGYAYNWVFARNCLACLSLTPAIAYKASDVDAETQEGKAWYSKFNLDFLLRAGVVYNNGKYFVGTSFVGKNYNYHRNNFSLDNGFGTLQVYVGFNFHLRKEYRKKETKREY
ncbi:MULTISPECIES: DUF4421 domain-containing protein [Bacteroides]|jgi:hypothetical protein|nr:MULTISPECIES: DUF4421 domain-containing protein [Bacteroides]KAA5217408.1 DUF4421 domain-containing protein [Bacteroides finegoldii]KAA5220197.1 DUF4421 domain-containing protein [Bacteroides finegoldii]KAA5224673.1 DUF4421 domain-containing protein [Bacteroides finegoldii]KAA5229188.1 DUF4421 domain-containing protein [Bacteroides finegoldii]KAA5233863.1 DUF4421 domain-containing protein [Bacteroides finegoldii]